MDRRIALRAAVSFYALLGFSGAAKSELIVGYTGTTTPVTTSSPGVTAENLTRSSGVIAGSDHVYSTKGWESNSSPVSTDYIEWGFTATPGFEFGINLTSLEIQYGRTGSGPTQLQIKVSINGGSFATIYTDTSVNQTATGPEHPVINLSTYDSVTSAIFRLYAYSANNSSGQLDLTNFSTSNPYAITITGLAATPEPGSLAVFGIGAVAAGYVGWRRRKATAAQKA